MSEFAKTTGINIMKKMTQKILIPQQTRWIGFDLDDTLHYFRKASGAAAETVFAYINEEFGAPLEVIRDTYKSILKQSQSTHFAKDWPSREYRADRFRKLLEQYSILPNGHLEHLLVAYDASLERNLMLTTGARDALAAAKRKGFGVFILSEGPHDAQETTIQRLGISQYVDVLLTSAREGLSKSDGLFERTLEIIGSRGAETVYVGDSMERDIIPAKRAGLTAIQLSSEKVEGTLAIPELSVLAQAIQRAPAVQKKDV
jgi:putative hydrolase of the HAD superfamily